MCVHVRMLCVHAYTQIYVCQERENNGKKEIKELKKSKLKYYYIECIKGSDLLK